MYVLADTERGKNGEERIDRFFSSSEILFPAARKFCSLCSVDCWIEDRAA